MKKNGPKLFREVTSLFSQTAFFAAFYFALMAGLQYLFKENRAFVRLEITCLSAVGSFLLGAGLTFGNRFSKTKKSKEKAPRAPSNKTVSTRNNTSWFQKTSLIQGKKILLNNDKILDFKNPTGTNSHLPSGYPQTMAPLASAESNLTPEETWHVMINNEKHGPYTVETIHNYLNEKKLISSFNCVSTTSGETKKVKDLVEIVQKQFA